MCIRDRLKTFPIFSRGQYGGGLILVKKDRRVKPLGSIAERTIGFSRDNFKVGIEGAYDSIPVSYTHLDVYKRQALTHNPPLPGGFSWQYKT